MGVLGYAKRKGKPVLEACCANATKEGKCNYNYIKNTIADYELSDLVESASIDVEETTATAPVVDFYKVDGSRYSIDAILARQEQEGGSNG